MTETSPTTVRRLERSADRGMVAGVCAGLGDYTDIDPVVFRVVMAVLTVAGGLGVLLYGLCWVLMPKAGEERSVVERVLHAPPGRLSTAPMVALIAAVAVLLSPTDHRGSVAITIAVVVIVAYAVHQRRGEPAVAVASPIAPSPPLPPPVPAPPRRRRERSPLGLLTVSAALLVTGVLTAIGSSGSTDLTPPRILAAAIVVLGLGLVVGAWYGRARWLLVLAVVTSLALAPVTVADAGVRDGTGDRTWVPAVADRDASYRLGVGDALLDLSAFTATESIAMTARVGVGHLVVLVPPGVGIRIVAHVRAGDVTFYGESRGGLGIDRTYIPPSGVTIGVLTVRVGLGEVEVRDA